MSGRAQVSFERPGGAGVGGGSVGPMSPTLGLTGASAALSPALPPTASEVGRALSERAVVRAVWRAVRDERIRATFRAARAAGRPAEPVLDALRGPHVDERGGAYYLSDESVRRIVYRKGAARRAVECAAAECAVACSAGA